MYNSFNSLIVYVQLRALGCLHLLYNLHPCALAPSNNSSHANFCVCVRVCARVRAYVFLTKEIFPLAHQTAVSQTDRQPRERELQGRANLICPFVRTIGQNGHALKTEREWLWPVPCVCVCVVCVLLCVCVYVFVCARNCIYTIGGPASSLK